MDDIISRFDRPLTRIFVFNIVYFTLNILGDTSIVCVIVLLCFSFLVFCSPADCVLSSFFFFFIFLFFFFLFNEIKMLQRNQPQVRFRDVRPSSAVRLNISSAVRRAVRLNISTNDASYGCGAFIASAAAQ